MRTASRAANDYIANILAMDETVLEILPRILDDVIFQVCFLNSGLLPCFCFTTMAYILNFFHGKPYTNEIFAEVKVRPKSSKGKI